MGFLSVEIASSLKLSCSCAACNGKDASLLSNLVDIQITASLFGSHGTYATFINILITDLAYYELLLKFYMYTMKIEMGIDGR